METYSHWNFARERTGFSPVTSTSVPREEVKYLPQDTFKMDNAQGNH